MKKQLLLLAGLATGVYANQIPIAQTASIANTINAILVTRIEKDLPDSLTKELNEFMEMLKDSGTESINENSFQELIAAIYAPYNLVDKRTLDSFIKQTCNCMLGQKPTKITSDTIQEPMLDKKPKLQANNNVISKPSFSSNPQEDIRHKCFICEYDDMYEEQTPLITLSCNHAFGHSNCIKGWFDILIQNGYDVSCPTCYQILCPQDWRNLFEMKPID